MKFNIPNDVSHITGKLEENGFKAYIVGGCVRDLISENEPKDWDICTSALPEDVVRCFSRHKTIKTGLKHGTVTVILDQTPYEITTFRHDGVYTDNRHPDNVEYTSCLEEDLSRRDFTINSLAYSDKTGIIDCYGGIDDIKNRIIRCVGDADKKFKEDALRIMRALRFSGELGYSIEINTADSLLTNKNLLNNIAAERIAAELNRLLVSKDVSSVLLTYNQVITEIIPELTATVGFDQNTPYHCYDVYKHIAISVGFAPDDIIIRLTMLLHDITKPRHFFERDGTGHFKGHQKTGADIASQVLSRLKYDKNTINIVSNLIIHHDADIQPESKQIKRWLNNMGEQGFRRLIQVKTADAKAHAPEFINDRLAVINDVSNLAEEIMEQRQCYTLGNLAINGKDLLAAGVPEGKTTGILLNMLLEMVMDELIPNDKVVLLAEAKKLLTEHKLY